ncbi:MAG TPA: hypothetical protein VF771_04270 [Longimicrobiaceae bacterium]
MLRLAATSLALLAAGCTDAPQRLVGPQKPNGDPYVYVTVHCLPTTLGLGSSGSCWAEVSAPTGTFVEPPIWWSSNPGVVEVNGQGYIHAWNTGSAEIFASVNGSIGSQTVVVPTPLPPLSISISGPTSITREGTYSWYAQESNRVSGETVTYRWDVSTDGGATWTQGVSTSAVYSRSLASGSPSFQLRLTSTSSAYRYPPSTTISKAVSVANPLLPPQLTVTVAGPDNISVAGTYTWTAYPSGGVPGYSYVWEKSTDGGSTWTLLLSSRYTYPIYTQTAEMYFGCGTSTRLNYRAKVTSSDGQVAYGYRSTNVYIPSC